MENQARIVIVGGGIMGVGLLYHLAAEGCRDVLLIEKGELTSGSTWHAAGQCPNLVGNYNLAKIHEYSISLYRKLEQLTGQAVGGMAAAVSASPSPSGIWTGSATCAESPTTSATTWRSSTSARSPG